MWVIRRSVVDWVCSKTQTLLETLKIRNQPRGGFCVSLEVEHSFLNGWMRKKQTSVSHVSTESEVISLDAGLRIDGILAPDVWDPVIEVLHSYKNIPVRRYVVRRHQRIHTSTNTKTKKHGNRDDIEFFSVDHVITNAKPPHFEVMLCVFEEKEAVIKMIIKG